MTTRDYLSFRDKLTGASGFQSAQRRRRTGTGGSSGVDYLDGTALRYRIFRELWAVRTLLVRAQDRPPQEDPERYGFAART